MTIWILALILIACCVGLGFRQGAIRVAFSFLGILFGALLAGPLAGLFQPLLTHLGAKEPGQAWAIAPIIGFVLVLAAFKVGGLTVHRKIEWKYKYRMSDTRLALWTRLNSRLGACAGLLNAAGYLILISFYIYNVSYWTVQIAAPNGESFSIRAINRFGEDLQSTGLAKAAKAVGKLPDNFYRFADLAGLVRQNPQATSRFLDYPGLTSLLQRDGVQALGQDTTFTTGWQQQAPLSELINDGGVQGLLEDKTFVDQATAVLQTDYSDLRKYMETGVSDKYGGEKILGKWDFNLATTLVYFRQSHPKMKPAELGQVRAEWGQAYAQTKVVFAGDNKVYLKFLPDFKSTTPTTMNGSGDWSANGADYKATVSLNGENKDFVASTSDGLRLVVKGMDNVLVFDHE